jgi:hypothetical protein
MTVSDTAEPAPAGLLLAGAGSEEDLPRRIAAAASRLAGLGGWPLRDLAGELPPTRALAALAGGRSTHRPPAWLAALAIDPGLPLRDGSSWAEALGAWRQPTALVLDADQLATGAPAAATALLRQWRVPLLGLIQWGGHWDGDARRCDGLPWLGVLASAGMPLEDEAGGDEVALLARLLLRWTMLDPG